MRTTIVLIILVMLAGAAPAQTYVSGNIQTDTTWYATNSPYVIQDQVTVLNDVTLTIQAGVTVAFEADSNLSSAWGGHIVADGAPGNRILFTSDAATPAPSDWHFVQPFGSDASSFTYCTFEYAADGLRANGSSPTVDHCTFRHCAYGVHCYNGSPVVTHSEITDCNIGIRIYGSSSIPSFNHCNIHGHAMGNLVVTYFPAPAATIDAENNWWGATGETAIAATISDAQDSGFVHATVDFDPWRGAMPVEEMSWGGVKAVYGR